MPTIRSYRGKLLDSDILFGADETPAIGNMNVNAGGDIIDENGRVVKTRDEVAREYYKDVKKSVVTSSILDEIDDDDSDFDLTPDPRFSKKAQATAKKAETTTTTAVDTTETDKSVSKSDTSSSDKESSAVDKSK